MANFPPPKPAYGPQHMACVPTTTASQAVHFDGMPAYLLLPSVKVQCYGKDAYERSTEAVNPELGPRECARSWPAQCSQPIGSGV